MGQIQPIPFLVPLAVGLCVIVATILIHALSLIATVTFYRRERDLGLTGQRFWIDVPIVGLAISLALAAHLVEIALWAFVLMITGEFSGFSIAYYRAALSYTTLGDGGTSPSWSMLGPLAAVDGMLMFGVSTAMIFAVIQHLFRTRYVDLRS